MALCASHLQAVIKDRERRINCLCHEGCKSALGGTAAAFWEPFVPFVLLNEPKRARFWKRGFRALGSWQSAGRSAEAANRWNLMEAGSGCQIRWLAALAPLVCIYLSRVPGTECLDCLAHDITLVTTWH